MSGQLLAEFRLKHPYNTCWLHIEYQHQPPEELFEALKAVDWAEETNVLPPCNRCAETTFTKGRHRAVQWLDAG